MKCSYCGKEIPSNSVFCSYCGKAQEKTLYCRKCGERIPTDSEFCQHCGTAINTQPLTPASTSVPIIQEKPTPSKKRRLWIIPIIAIPVVVAAILLLILLPQSPFHKQEISDEPTTTIEDQITTSKYLGIKEFKENYSAYEGSNLHISGYVIEGSPNNRVIGMTVAESLDTPYDFEDVLDYFPFTNSIDEINAHQAEFDSWPKTATVYAELLPNGQCEKTPIVGDYVDVFFVGDGRVKVSAYCIKVH